MNGGIEKQPKSIRILSTGGTIDSSPDYDPNKKSVFEGSQLPTILKQSRLSIPVILEPLMQKDSADLNREDRELIFKKCVQSPETQIIITHGTDTMVETARFLGQRILQDKTVVLVGSFVPFSQKDSDAFFNLGFALASAQRLISGVWIAMGGETFSWDDVQKNMKEKVFERLG